MRKLEAYSDLAYAALRIMSGWMFAFHGMQKLFGVWMPFRATFPGELWFAAIIEFCGGLMIALGVRARWAAFICSGEMAVAYFQGHWKFQFGRNFFPPINQGEMAVLYCFIFLYIACRGGGKYAIGRD